MGLTGVLSRVALLVDHLGGLDFKRDEQIIPASSGGEALRVAHLR
jgi:hypothetical protein